MRRIKSHSAKNCDQKNLFVVIRRSCQKFRQIGKNVIEPAIEGTSIRRRKACVKPIKIPRSYGNWVLYENK